ncbi:MAG: hypothetical protein ACK4OJ_12440, partial [Brevundimonas sp.]
MGEYDNADRGPSRLQRHRMPLAGGAVAVLVLLIAVLLLASCGDGAPAFWRRGGPNEAALSCPRPASITGSEFNAQEAGLRHLRRAAFRGDDSILRAVMKVLAADGFEVIGAQQVLAGLLPPAALLAGPAPDA